MVVCVCNAIRENEVIEAVRGGARCPLSAYAALGRRPRCGRCVPFAKELIDQAAAA